MSSYGTIAIIDYGAGNLGSVHKALKRIGADVTVTSDPNEVARSDRLVLPGVGAFASCMAGLSQVGLAQATRDFVASGRPFLGICVGMQMLFDESEEMGAAKGLGLLPGKVVRFKFGSRGGSHPPTESSEPFRISQLPIRNLKVPHIGWNTLQFADGSPLFCGLEPGDRVYFVHSYYPEPANTACIAATSDYGYTFCCAVSSGNIHATQFHPEKSGEVGLTILRNFATLPS